MFGFKKKQKINNSKQLIEIEKNEILKYEKETTHKENLKIIKLIFCIFFSIVLIIVGNLVIAIFRLFASINIIFGFISLVVCLIFLIFFLIVPIFKLCSIRSFTISFKNSEKYNKKLCNDIAIHIIEFSENVPNNSWYDEKLVNELKIAKKERDSNKLRKILTDLINSSIRNTSNKLMKKYALKSAVYSAISQSNKLDAILVLFINLAMIKDLVYLYGFRPTTIKMCKVFISIFYAVATAYALESSNVGKKVLSGIARIIPAASTFVAVGAPEPTTKASAAVITTISSLIQGVFDSSIQGATNGIITAMIGYQTIDYLNKEFRLQDVLKDIDLLDSEEEMQDTQKQILQELKKNNKA